MPTAWLPWPGNVKATDIGISRFVWIAPVAQRGAQSQVRAFRKVARK